MNEKFLKAYKELEQELGEVSVYDYSLGLDKEAGDKLNLCRIIRNYLSHNADDFVKATKEMTEFTQSRAKAVRAMRTTVKDTLLKVKPVEPGESLEVVARRLMRTEALPVVEDGEYKGVYTDRSVREGVYKGKCTLIQINVVSPDSLLSEVKELSVVCKGKKYMGVVKPV